MIIVNLRDSKFNAFLRASHIWGIRDYIDARYHRGKFNYKHFVDARVQEEVEAFLNTLDYNVKEFEYLLGFNVKPIDSSRFFVNINFDRKATKQVKDLFALVSNTKCVLKDLESIECQDEYGTYYQYRFRVHIGTKSKPSSNGGYFNLLLLIIALDRKLGK